jgi:poly(3-hydroxybutyrate) depolymerase
MPRYLALGFGAIIGFLGIAAVVTLAGGASAANPASPALPALHDAAQSAGCGRQAVPAGEVPLKSTEGKSTDGKGRPRTYLIHMPAGYDASRPYPLIFVFHGSGGNSRQSYSWGLQNVAGASSGAIFVFPDGIAYKNLGIGWDDAPDGYDLPFFDHMQKDIEAQYCIDTTRVFVAGFSWGGDFATALACNRAAAIRAVAANSTDDEFKDRSNYLTYAGLPCRGGRHPAIRFEHAAGGDVEYPAPYFATTSRLFQYLNSCSGASSETAPRTSVSAAASVCVSYKACAAEYLECTFDHGIGHALPPNWAKDTWDFFSTF